jgi:hypothetical protein
MPFCWPLSPSRHGRTSRRRAAADRKQSDAHLPRDARALGGRDFAACDRRQNGCQRLPAILGGAGRSQVDPEALSRILGGERRRHQLRGEGQ